MQIKSNPIAKYVIVIILFILQYQPMFAQTKVDSLETVYLKFQIPKIVGVEIGSFKEGYTSLVKQNNSITFSRVHEYLSSCIDLFKFDKKRYMPKKISHKNLAQIKVSDFKELEKKAEKQKLFSTPGKLFPNITIIAVEEGKGIFLYEHVKWERTVAIE